MEKNRFMRLYLRISIVLAIFILIVNLIFIWGFPIDSTQFPYGFNGTVEKTLFEVTFINMSGNVEVFNWPLIIHFGFFIVTVLTAALALTGEQLKKKKISEFMVYNVIISLLLVISSLVFMFLIPDTINGVIKNGIIFTKMPIRTDDIATVFNLSFVLIIIYIGMNIYVLSSTAETKVLVDEDFNEGELLL